MSFEIRLQRDPALATPQDLRNDVGIQKVAAALQSVYMKKQVPTTAQDVKAEIELTYPGVGLQPGIVYHQYTNPVTGDTYWCCKLSNTLTVLPPGEDPIIVELTETKLVP